MAVAVNGALRLLSVVLPPIPVACEPVSTFVSALRDTVTVTPLTTVVSNSTSYLRPTTVVRGRVTFACPEEFVSLPPPDLFAKVAVVAVNPSVTISVEAPVAKSKLLLSAAKESAKAVSWSAERRSDNSVSYPRS